jgi:hypothetical protein
VTLAGARPLVSEDPRSDPGDAKCSLVREKLGIIVLNIRPVPGPVEGDGNFRIR